MGWKRWWQSTRKKSANFEANICHQMVVESANREPDSKKCDLDGYASCHVILFIDLHRDSSLFLHDPSSHFMHDILSQQPPTSPISCFSLFLIVIWQIYIYIALHSNYLPPCHSKSMQIGRFGVSESLTLLTMV